MLREQLYKDQNSLNINSNNTGIVIGKNDGIINQINLVPKIMDINSKNVGQIINENKGTVNQYVYLQDN